jgi:hypothetical protein
MMRRYLNSFLAFCLLAVSWGSVKAQAPDYEYFNETGHNVQGEFLKFYHSAPDPILLYGYPITEQITSKDGKTVQYFQRARFELRNDLPEGQRVQLSLLGHEMYSPQSPLNVSSAFACRFYSETDFSVCFAFLEFFDKNGGVTQFGYPISSFEYHENMIVQYFEKARLEWRPWNPEVQRVIVSDLGRIYFDKLGEDPGLLTSAPPAGNIVAQLISIQVRAFVWKAVTLASDQQVIFVVAQDQRGQPVTGAQCTSVIHWPNGQTDSRAISTNSNGVGIVSLSFTDQPYGNLIYIDISCDSNGLKGITTTSFRIWY